MPLKEYEAVVFDMDGVIFDSERAFRECWVDFSKKYNIKNIDEVYLRCTGVTTQGIRKILTDEYGEDFPFDAYIKDTYDLFHKKYDGGRLPLKPGVREILQYLKSENIKIALASSTAVDMVKNELRDAGLLHYFDKVIGGDMVEKSKPCPDIFLRACEELGVEPHNAYAVEDSFNGIRAAFSGGLRPIMVPDLLQPDDEMREKTETICENLVCVTDYIKLVERGNNNA